MLTPIACNIKKLFCQINGEREVKFLRAREDASGGYIKLGVSLYIGGRRLEKVVNF